MAIRTVGPSIKIRKINALVQSLNSVLRGIVNLTTEMITSVPSERIGGLNIICLPDHLKLTAGLIIEKP